MDKNQRNTIASELLGCVTNTIERLDNQATHRPFHAALLSKDALFWSRFERSFSTSFGQGAIERISKIAAIVGGASNASNQRVTNVALSKNAADAIADHLSDIRHGNLGRAPNWKLDLAKIKAANNKGGERKFRVISDLWWKKNGSEHFMSIKTVKPNIDQTIEAKRDLMKLAIGVPQCRAFFGLYYNPYGEKRTSYDWKPPMGVFDFRADPVVLIGRDYWETLGGSGFYDELLAIANTVGETTQKRLNKLRDTF